MKAQINRRGFVKSTALLATGSLGFSFAQAEGTPNLLDDNESVIGPREGFSPHVGTLLSMMTWMRTTILYPVQGMTKEQLDYLHDDKSNSIGSMLMHLAATERFYAIHTFEGKKWGDWPEAEKKRFGVAMALGDPARKTLKGNDLNFYLDTLKEVRENTIKEFKKRDDKWLMTIDQTWGWGPTNNYCKWFHVCEHESNHNGQIKWIKGRLPGAKASNE